MKKKILQDMLNMENQALELKNYIKILKNSIDNENEVDYIWDFVDIILDKTEQNYDNIENFRIEIGNILLD